MSLKYEPVTVPQHISVKWLFFEYLAKMMGKKVVGKVAPQPSQLSIYEQPLYRNVQWFRGGLVFEAHSLLYHSA